MELETAINMVSPHDAEFLLRLAAWKNSRPLGAVETALTQVAFTSLYRDRTGSTMEHLDALERLKRALTD